MEKNDMTDEVNPFETRDRFIKLMLGTIVSFVAVKTSENLYDKFVVERRLNKIAEIQQ